MTAIVQTCRPSKYHTDDVINNHRRKHTVRPFPNVTVDDHTVLIKFTPNLNTTLKQSECK